MQDETQFEALAAWEALTAPEVTATLNAYVASLRVSWPGTSWSLEAADSSRPYVVIMLPTGDGLDVQAGVLERAAGGWQFAWSHTKSVHRGGSPMAAIAGTGTVLSQTRPGAARDAQAPR